MNRPSLFFLCACAALTAGGSLADAATPAPVPAPPAAPAAPATPAAPTPPDLLRFLDNQDALHGRLAAYTAGDGALWQHPQVAAPFAIRPGNFDCLVLGERPAAAHAAPASVFLFNNGDALAGTLVEYTAQKTTVDTWYAGRLSFDSRALCGWVALPPAPVYRTQGFGKPESWKATEGQDAKRLRFRDGRMILSQGLDVSKRLPFPPKFQLEVDFTLTGGVAGGSCTLGLLGNGPNGNDNNGYWISFSDSKAVIQHTTDSDQEQLGEFPCRLAETQRVTVCADAEARTLTVLVDGKKIGTAKDPHPFPEGKWLGLSDPNGGKITFSNLTLAAWDGQLRDTAPPKARAKADTLLMANQDKVSGRLLSMQNGRIAFKTEFTTLDIPMARVTRLDLSEQSNLSPKRADGDVEVFFNATDRLTLNLQSIQDGRLAARSANLGDCSLDLAAARKVVFNLDSPVRLAREAERKAEEEEDMADEKAAEEAEAKELKELEDAEAEAQKAEAAAAAKAAKEAAE